MVDNKSEKKVLVFDSSTLINFAMNSSLDILVKLKQKFNVRFIISKAVKSEVIDRPLQIKNYELEALRIKKLLDDKILEMPDSLGISENEINSETSSFMDIANNMYTAQGERMRIVSRGECSCIALSIILAKKKIDSLVVIDERTARMLLEKPENLRDLYAKKLHTPIKMNYNRATDLPIRVIRSSELVYIAHKKNLIEIKDGKQLLDALLYAVKYKGCAISLDEIEELKELV